MTKSFSGDKAFLSNFYPVTIRYENLDYPSVEHAYQAAKTDDYVLKIYIAALATPGQAKKAGRGLILREDWELMKLMVMKDLLRLKFKDPTLRRMLLDTGDEVLQEVNSWGDTFWGVCPEGKNWLGRLLMQLRLEIWHETRS